MKRIKIIAAFCCLFSVFNTSVAQENVIPDGRRWIIHRKNVVNPEIKEQIWTHYIKGSSVKDGKTYSNMYCDDAGLLEYVRKDGAKWYSYDATFGDTLTFDESWNVGDTTFIDAKRPYNYGVVIDVNEVQGRKCWKMDGYYGGTWIEDVGYTTGPHLSSICLLNSYSDRLICCIDPGNDTLYVNRDLLPLLQTGINDISADNISFTRQGNDCIVTLPANVSAWSATLFNSSGAAVARRLGEGSEIILPATSKGTHILVLNVGGRVVKKKVFIK